MSADALRQLAPGLWTLAAPLRAVGVQMGRHMTVVRLTDGGLWVHSPAPLNDALRHQLDALGPLRHVVAPSNLHGHRFMEQYAAAYPGAALWAAPGLARRRRDLDFAGVLESGVDTQWGDELAACPFQGHRWINEIEFLHAPSRTLISADLCFHIGPAWPLLTRLFAGGPRRRGDLGPTPFFRAGIRDRAAAAQSIARLLEWDFDRILVGHGDDIETGGHEAFRRAFAWLAGGRVDG